MNITSKEADMLPIGISSCAEEAEKYLKTIYPNITYNKEKDTFLYQNREFNYFMSGYCIPQGKALNTYLLTDPQTGVWLFTYGNLDERWKDFLDQVQSWHTLRHSCLRPHKVLLLWPLLLPLILIIVGILLAISNNR